MVTGIKPVSKDDDGTEQEYDCIGVIYPEGYLMMSSISCLIIMM